MTDNPEAIAPDSDEEETIVVSPDEDGKEAKQAEEQLDTEEVEGEEGKETAPRLLTDAEIDQALQSPRGQQMMVGRIQELAQRTQAEAKAKETIAEAKKMIDAGDYEGLGRAYEALMRGYESAQAQQAQEQQLAERAVEYFYRNVLPVIAEQGDHQTVLRSMTQEERWNIHPDNPRFAGVSDEQYIATYLDAVAQKRIGLNVTTGAKKLFDEWKAAEENKQVGDTVRGGSVTTPPGKPGTAVPDDARSLIRAGLSEEALQPHPLEEEKED